jgi:hypothetical protein
MVKLMKVNFDFSHKILGTSTPGKNFVIFSNKICGMSSGDKKNFAIFSQKISWVRVLS